MANRVVEVLDKKIDELDARLKGLRAVRDLFADNSSISTEVVEAILHENSNGFLDLRQAAVDKTASPHLAPVLKFFKVNNNQWASIPDISTALGIKRASLHVLMGEGKHCPMFESKLLSIRHKVWRVKFADPEAPAKSQKSPKKKPPPKKPAPKPVPVEAKSQNIPKPKWAPAGAEYEMTETGDVKRVK